MKDYEDEVRTRSRLARSARKKRGRRRGCALPSDNLTEAQWRRRNGPVVVIHGGTGNE